MRAKTSIYDFSFIPSGYGHCKVTYTSPVTGKQRTAITNDMPLTDATKNADDPKRCDLETLKRVCKNGLGRIGSRSARMTAKELNDLYKSSENFIADCTRSEVDANLDALNKVQSMIRQRMILTNE